MKEIHKLHMQQALLEAARALAEGEFPVGCVLVADGKIVARGRRKNSRTPTLGELDHAEIVALRSLAAFPKEWRPPLVAYTTMEPCLMCFATLLLNGVHTVIYGFEDVMGGGTGLDLSELPPLYRQLAPTIIGGVCRSESLSLFHQFFANPANDYWQNSLLANYVLEQAP
jgi:tRNA(adenine34) deaminase